MEDLPVTPESILPVLLLHVSPSGRLARTPTNSAFTSPKLFPSVLNALASISVEKADSHPTAVALENTQDRTKLFVACDTGVSTQLSDHLSSIWALTRQISNRVPLHLASPQAGTRAYSDEDIAEWERQLAAQIYRFSWQKFCARIHKRMDSLLDGLKLMVESSAETQQPERHKLCKYLLDSFQSIRTVVTNTCPNDTMLVGINTALLALSVGLRPYLDSQYSLLDSIQHRIGMTISPLPHRFPFLLHMLMATTQRNCLIIDFLFPSDAISRKPSRSRAVTKPSSQPPTPENSNRSFQNPWKSSLYLPPRTLPSMPTSIIHVFMSSARTAPR